MISFLKLTSMLQKMLLICLLTFVISIANAQQLDCYKFKEGKFRINDARAGGVIIAERKGDYQTESMEALKAIVRFKITWLNDCSYMLALDKVLRNENKVSFPNNLTVNVMIITIDANGYTQQTTSSITNGSYRCAVTKL